MARKLTFAAILLFTPTLVAQEHPEPPPRPASKPIAPKTATPPQLRDDSIPGLEDSDFRISPAPLRREGSFIIRQRGSLVRLPGGEKAFVFHKDDKGRAERPMVLLPCITLQSMEQIASDRSEDTAFLITGQVFAYRKVNYLLPTAAPVATAAAPAEKPPEKPAPSSSDPAVEDLIRGLEAQRARPRTLGGEPAPASPAAAPKDLLPENSTISLKRGRVVRLSGGQWAFAIDNSPSGEAASDRVLIFNPCLNLQRLETLAQHSGDGATLLLSGRIYQYQGRNHIIPTMFQIATPAELSPRQ